MSQNRGHYLEMTASDLHGDQPTWRSTQIAHFPDSVMVLKTVKNTGPGWFPKIDGFGNAYSSKYGNNMVIGFDPSQFCHHLPSLSNQNVHV